MKTIPLTRGLVALVDDADYDAVSKFKWHAVKIARRFYAAQSIKKSDGKYGLQLMHRFLMPGIVEIDHRDGNGLNNQRHNLRPATAQQNRWGFRLKAIGKTSKFRGVGWNREKKKWQAKITVTGKCIHLGWFTYEKDAARAYDSAAVFYFGEWASTNFDIGQITITSLYSTTYV